MSDNLKHTPFDRIQTYKEIKRMVNKGNSFGIVDKLQEIHQECYQAKERIAELEAALKDISKYWNLSENDRAMHMIKTAERCSQRRCPMKFCLECGILFPEKYVQPFITSLGSTPCCAICALKLKNEIYGLNDKKFNGPRANALLRDTKKFIAKQKQKMEK